MLYQGFVVIPVGSGCLLALEMDTFSLVLVALIGIDCISILLLFLRILFWIVLKSSYIQTYSVQTGCLESAVAPYLDKAEIYMCIQLS